jgi:hypothetical protein
MIRKLQILLLVPLAVLLFALLYRLTPTPNKTNEQPKGTVVEGSPAAMSGSFSDADFARHVEQLKKKLPGNEFTVVIQPPFVVIGDESPESVKEHSKSTVKWAVDKLKQDFFTKDPKEILDIWLLKDYSSAHQALIMNISTGGGTLVHEIVHPFMEANFPECPPWFNEGLGSLYEQSGEVNGHIHGYTNWRLPGLQKAIKAGKVPEFKSLTALDAHGFYDEDKGTNYGQARYLCYYLQEHGLLIKFYRDFRARQKQDPTGYKSLQKTLGTVDMRAFKQKWEKYVLGLSQDVVLTPIPPSSGN